jgi:hypothetical protein
VDLLRLALLVPRSLGEGGASSEGAAAGPVVRS